MRLVMLWLVLSLAVGCMCLLASCKAEVKADRDGASVKVAIGEEQLGTSTRDDSPEPEPVNAADLPKVTKLVIGDERDAAETRITHETRILAPYSPICIDARLEELSTGSEIRVTAKLGLPGAGKELAEGIAADSDEQEISICFDPPNDGWPEGEHAIEISVDGAVVSTVTFEVMP